MWSASLDSLARSVVAGRHGTGTSRRRTPFQAGSWCPTGQHGGKSRNRQTNYENMQFVSCLTPSTYVLLTALMRRDSWTEDASMQVNVVPSVWTGNRCKDAWILRSAADPRRGEGLCVPCHLRRRVTSMSSRGQLAEGQSADPPRLDCGGRPCLATICGWRGRDLRENGTASGAGRPAFGQPIRGLWYAGAQARPGVVWEVQRHDATMPANSGTAGAGKAPGGRETAATRKKRSGPRLSSPANRRHTSALL